MKRNWLLIGIGGAGCTMSMHVHAALGGRLLHLNHTAMGAAPLSEALSTLDPRAPSSARRIRDHMRHVGATLVAELGDEPIVFIFVGLGGATGTGVVVEVARLAVELGREVHVLATLPFDYETTARMVASDGLARLGGLDVHLHVHDHALASSQGLGRTSSMNEILGLADTSMLSYCMIQLSTQAA